MLRSRHNRRIGGEAADPNLRGSRGAPQKTSTATRRRVVKGRRAARAGQAEAKICLFPHKWMQPVPVLSGGMQWHRLRGTGDVALPFWAALHLS